MASSTTTRYYCDIDECPKNYAHLGSLRTHQSKLHASIFTRQGLKAKKVRTTAAKRQKLTDEPPPATATVQAPSPSEQHTAVLESRIAVLESRLAAITSLQSEREAAVEARLSEMYALIVDLKEQLALIAKKNTKWCVVCFSKENDYAFMPCRHKCVCQGCAKATYDRYRECPICRQPITSAKQIYDLSAM